MNRPLDFVWLIPVLPFLGALLNGVILRGRISKKAAAFIACLMTGIAAALAIGIILDYTGDPSFAGEHWKPFERDYYMWMPAGPIHTVVNGVRDFNVPLGFLIDPLSCVMLFVVTFVGFLIHLYSWGYMAHEDGFQRFFTYLNLFMGAMLLLILGNSYAVMFVGWEGVGLCSYLLIGFYFKEEFPPYAGRKAFIVNRIGDFAFVIGVFALISTFGTLKYTELFPAIAANQAVMSGAGWIGLSLASFIALCLFVGATGKSAQIPLYVWLPDAMAGPTPVSALIHAATMVTAGVYMVVRSNAIYQLAGGVSMLVAIIGAATALFAATIAIAQNDIKKVLAYSTVSQLGYMFLAAGLGAYTAAIFHVMTHAFFKALLFLGSGSVIHAMGGEQDMRKMGGLKKYLPHTSRTYFIGALAIAGVPGLAGFFSKDEILHNAAAGNHWVLWAVGILTAALTAVYMFRSYYLTFQGHFRGTHEQEHHLHESPPIMTGPLYVLAAGAILAGLVGIPKLLTFGFLPENVFGHFLQPVIGEHEAHHMDPGLEWGLLAIAVAIAVGGWLLARRIYGGDRGTATDDAFEARMPAVQRTLANKYYVDEIYDATVIRGFWAACRRLFRFDAGFIDGFLVNGVRNVTVEFLSLASSLFDKFVVDGLVNGVGNTLAWGSRKFRRVQTGFVSNYALVLAAGMFALVCAFLLLRMR
ncbi:MAG TPA: NADH-quinone oxidoreductase subunit L [Thermoanaerobaculia bacterium]|jgi:NADH-quinone oxidoreductase subunit L|nr:NADH-quinone oxidoreductase subunit L [Thermoanaerobaculia bacterium]